MVDLIRDWDEAGFVARRSVHLLQRKFSNSK